MSPIRFEEGNKILHRKFKDGWDVGLPADTEFHIVSVGSVLKLESPDYGIVFIDLPTGGGESK